MNGDRSPVRLLESAASIFGDKLAVVCGTGEWTYSQFADYCWRLARATVDQGMQPADRVAFLMPSCHKLLAASFGIPAAGCVLVPLNPRLPVEELVCIVENAQPRCLFYAAELRETADLLKRRCRLEQVICFDDGFLGSYGPTERLTVSEDAPAEIIYTSGTTGSPKGALFSHRTLYEHAQMIARLHGRSASVVLHNIPLFHANGWGLAHGGTCIGATHVVLPRFDPHEIGRAIDKHGVTYMGLVPVMAKRMLEAKLPSNDFRSLLAVEIGGAPVERLLIEDCQSLFGCEVFVGYGMTEAGPLIASGRRAANAFPQSLCGLELATPSGIQVRVVDEKGIEMAADGQSVGELVVHSPGQMREYWNSETEANTEPFMLDHKNLPFLKTGDLAVWNEAGRFAIVDRKKDIIIKGGAKISSANLEMIIALHPNIEECAVVAMPDESWGEVPAVFVCLKAGTFLRLQDVQNFLEGRLGRFYWPDSMTVVHHSLPRTAAGKVLKKELIAL